VKILEIMERANSRDTSLVIAYVKDAISEMQSSNEIDTKVSKINIVKNTRDYDLPSDLISIKTIRRLSSEPLITEDTNP
jgi:hypothetical protein